MDAAAERGRNPVSKHRIQPEYEDEQADAGRDCQTRLVRPNSQARTRTGNIRFPSSADLKQDWQPYPVDPYSCYMCDDTYQRSPTVVSSLGRYDMFSMCVSTITLSTRSSSDGPSSPEWSRR